MQSNSEEEVKICSHLILQRKLCVEFMNNLEALKKKTSHAKKTCHALSSFFIERMSIEQYYANKLSSLAKTGK